MKNCTQWLTDSLILIAVCAIAGCSNAVAPQPPGGEPSGGQSHVDEGSAAKSTGLPELSMNVVIQKGSRDDYKTESVKTFPNPTAGQIEEQVRALDWKNTQRWPYVGLGRLTQGRTGRRLSIEGLLGAPDPEVALRAQWIGVEGETEFLRRSAPLESLDAAIQLLLAFRGDDPNLKTMTEWKLERVE